MLATPPVERCALYVGASVAALHIHRPHSRSRAQLLLFWRGIFFLHAITWEDEPDAPPPPPLLQYLTDPWSVDSFASFLDTAERDSRLLFVFICDIITSPAGVRGKKRATVASWVLHNRGGFISLQGAERDEPKGNPQPCVSQTQFDDLIWCENNIYPVLGVNFAVLYPPPLPPSAEGHRPAPAPRGATRLFIFIDLVLFSPLHRPVLRCIPEDCRQGKCRGRRSRIALPLRSTSWRDQTWPGLSAKQPLTKWWHPRKSTWSVSVFLFPLQHVQRPSSCTHTHMHTHIHTYTHAITAISSHYDQSACS